MDLTWATIEDLARTSDDAAVRRRFDRQNFRWLIGLLIFFGFVAFLEAVAETRRNSVIDVVIATANFAVVATTFFLLFSRTTKEWMRRRISATVITFVLVEYALVLAFTRTRESWVVWACIMPMLLLRFRMPVAELALMHAVLAAGGVFMAFATTLPGGNEDKFAIAVVVINVLTLLTEGFFSRRLRKEIVLEWSERRGHAREQLRMRDELQYARELQLSMLPERPPSLEWADICGVSIPAKEVGGDYYDYFADANHVAIVSGDVAGHGMASGIVLAAMRGGFTLLRDSLHDPAVVLRRLHDLVTQTSRRRMLVSASILLVDYPTRRAIIASAGHPPILVRRANGTVETIELFAPPLGVRLPVNIPQRTIDFASGDVFVLHSDGIYETRNPAGEDYGLERLANVVRAHGGDGAESLRDAILRDVAAFRGNAEAEDDVTVVVCSIR